MERSLAGVNQKIPLGMNFESPSSLDTRESQATDREKTQFLVNQLPRSQRKRERELPACLSLSNKNQALIESIFILQQLSFFICFTLALSGEKPWLVNINSIRREHAIRLN
jgi:hypothetical protein